MFYRARRWRRRVSAAGRLWLDERCRQGPGASPDILRNDNPPRLLAVERPEMA